MKLKRLKILTAFRGLPAGFEMEFRQRQTNGKSFEPLCMVGLNGSGKSNVLQALSEIFYYMEMYCLALKEEKLKMNTFFGFVIEYWISEDQKEESGLNNLVINADTETVADYISFEKKTNELPQFSVRPYNYSDPVGYGDFFTYSDKDLNPSEIFTVDFKKLLPRNIIGYSSGMNELVSNAFIKIDFHYFDSFQKSIERQEYGVWEMNRLFFMDYDSNKMVVLCNYLFWDQDIEKKKKLGILNQELGITDIERFSITIRFANYNHDELPLTSQLILAIDKLKKCASAWQDNVEVLVTGEKDKRVLRMDFLVDGAIRKAFRSNFKTAQLLYRDLYLLRLLNTEMFGKNLQNEVRDASSDVNLSALIPKLPQQQLIFSIDDIALKKQNVKKSVYYRQLSDGEHQLLHVLGAIMLMEWPGTLFIMDEPETHFNPEWRSKFVSLLNKISEAEEIAREQDIVLTSHSPFIVSDCKTENVFIFKRNADTRMVEKPLNPDFNTYGASVNLITSKVFEKKETIAGMANDIITNLKEAVKNNVKTVEQAKEEINALGDSVEKIIFLDELSKVNT